MSIFAGISKNVILHKINTTSITEHFSLMGSAAHCTCYMLVLQMSPSCVLVSREHICKQKPDTSPSFKPLLYVHCVQQWQYRMPFSCMW